MADRSFCFEHRSHACAHARAPREISDALQEIRRQLGPLTTVTSTHDQIRTAEVARRLVDLTIVVEKLADKIDALDLKGRNP